MLPAAISIVCIALFFCVEMLLRTREEHPTQWMEFWSGWRRMLFCIYAILVFAIAGPTSCVATMSSGAVAIHQSAYFLATLAEAPITVLGLMMSAAYLPRREIGRGLIAATAGLWYPIVLICAIKPFLS